MLEELLIYDQIKHNVIFTNIDLTKIHNSCVDVLYMIIRINNHGLPIIKYSMHFFHNLLYASSCYNLIVTRRLLRDRI